MDTPEHNLELRDYIKSREGELRNGFIVGNRHAEHDAKSQPQQNASSIRAGSRRCHTCRQKTVCETLLRVEQCSAVRTSLRIIGLILLVLGWLPFQIGSGRLPAFSHDDSSRSRLGSCALAEAPKALVQISAVRVHALQSLNWKSTGSAGPSLSANPARISVGPMHTVQVALAAAELLQKWHLVSRASGHPRAPSARV